MTCIFCKIAAGNDPSATLLYEDEQIVAFNDKYPAANHHFLVIPKRHIKNINGFTKEDLELVKKMKEIGFRIISEKLGNDESPITSDKYLMGFGSPPFNSVFHVHMHVLSKPVTCYWPRSMKFGNWIFRNVDDVIAKL
ncbi:14313_t:CDS:2 [Cetraspora pellucida]|uniref:14313_t:CDS:1 n=1 Tax=Cetraspora pellucida TaxID=1433469 RepID=A0A9N9D678_9GLOM|nr:14313_t:CDS:2 [Cetraspora pellucida]